MSLALRPAPRLAPRALDAAPSPWAATVDTWTGPDLLAQDALALDFAHHAPPTAPTTGPPAPGPAVQSLVQAVLEVLDGRRSPLTLQRAATPTVLTALVRRAATRRGPQGATRPTIRRLRVAVPEPTRAEAAAVVVLGGRVRAVALAVTWNERAWVLDALEIG